MTAAVGANPEKFWRIRRMASSPWEPVSSSLQAAGLAAVEEDHPLGKQLTKFDQMVARALRRAIRAGTTDLGQVITADAQPAEPQVSLDDLTAIEASWRESLADELIPYLATVYGGSAERMFREIVDHLAEAAADAGPALDLSSPAAAVHLSEAENRLRGIGTDVWRSVRLELVEGLQEGEDVAHLQARVRSEMAASTVRAQTIARTEVISASNAGALEQVRAAPPTAQPQFKVWLATGDHRTRPSHRAADGDKVPIDGQFTVGGGTLRYPGDPTGPAEETINCRCSLTWEWT